MAVYLWLQVRSAPAQAEVSHPQAQPPRTAENMPAKTEGPSEPPVWKGGKVHVGSGAVEQPTAAPPTVTDTPAPVMPTDDQKVNLKLDNLMEVANKAYDRQD